MALTGKYSITQLVADALGVDKKLIPESLRNRMNTYRNNSTIPKEMFDEKLYSSASERSSIDFKRGFLTYVRNLVVLDTLFDDTKKVRDIMLNKLTLPEKKKVVDELMTEATVRRKVLGSIESHYEELSHFLCTGNIDFNHTEVPTVFGDVLPGSSIVQAHFANTEDANLSSHDQVIKLYLSNDIHAALKLLDRALQAPNPTKDLLSLKTLFDHEVAKAKSYNSFLSSL